MAVIFFYLGSFGKHQTKKSVKKERDAIKSKGKTKVQV